MLKFTKYALLMVSMCLATPLTAQTQTGECEGRWELNVLGTHAELSQQASQAAWIPVQIRMEETLARCVDYLVVGPPGGGPWVINNGFDALELEPYDANRSRLMRSDQGRGWILPLTGISSQFSFWLRVPDVGQASPGAYVGILDAELGSSRGGDELHYSLQSQQFEYVVESRVALQIDTGAYSWLNGSNSFYRVDLGTLRDGVSREFDLQVQSNSDVAISISSQNQGELRHAMQSSASIPYRVELNSQPVNLAGSSMDLPRANSRTSWNVPVRISVPNVDQSLPAGEYTDIITIDAYARY